MEFEKSLVHLAKQIKEWSDEKFAKLEQEQTQLKLAIDQVETKEGPQGPVGEAGPQGEKGADGTSVSADEILKSLVADEEFIKSITGPQGDQGPMGEVGPQGEKGLDGSQGTPGKDADPVPPEVISSLLKEDETFLKAIQGAPGEQGPAGEKGADGKSVEVSEVIESLVSDEDFVKAVMGKEGPIGIQGPSGEKGADGQDGRDADPVEVAKALISDESFVSSLKGEKGEDADPEVIAEILKSDDYFLERVQGLEGDRGEDGADGRDGLGIKAFEISDEGDLAVEMTDGQIVELGNIRGPQGKSVDPEIIVKMLQDSSEFTQAVRGPQGEMFPEDQAVEIIKGLVEGVTKQYDTEIELAVKKLSDKEFELDKSITVAQEKAIQLDKAIEENNRTKVIQYTPESLVKMGSWVEHNGRYYVANRDTDSVPGDSTAYSLVLRGFEFKKAWSADTQYERLDVVISATGSAWVANKNAPEGEPGSTPDWNLLVKRGERGAKGDIGDQGPKGEKGSDGVSITGLSFDYAKEELHIEKSDGSKDAVDMPLLTMVKDLVGDAWVIRQNDFELPINDFRGAWHSSVSYNRGDVVQFMTGLYIAKKKTTENVSPNELITSRTHKQCAEEWQNFMLFPGVLSGGGGGTTGGAGLPTPPTAQAGIANNIKWDPVTQTWVIRDGRGDYRVYPTMGAMQAATSTSVVDGAQAMVLNTDGGPTAISNPGLFVRWGNAWYSIMPTPLVNNYLQSLEYDPERPMGNRLTWRDDRDRMATVNTEADLNNRTILPASHLKPGKLVYVINEGVLYECLNDSSTLTNTLADWKEVGVGSTIRAGRVGNLPTATSAPPPVPNQLAIVTFDVDGNSMDRLYVWELNTTSNTYSWVPMETRSVVKALRSDTDVSHDLAPGDVQYTVEQGHAEIKVADAAGTLQTIFSKDAIDAAIAAGNQFQGTVQDTGHGVRGAIDFASLPRQTALGAADKSHYWIYVGTPGHAIGVNEIGGAVSAVDGQVLNVGDWIIVGSTTTGTGPAAVTTYQYNVIPGDLLAKARGDNLYGFNAWAAGAYEAGSIVTYKGDVWKATGAVVRTDAAPGTPASSGPPIVTAPPWAKVDISGGVRSVASDTDLPATAANGTIYLVLSSAANSGKQTLFSYDNPGSKWEQLSGGGSASGGNLQLSGGTPVHNIGVPIGTVIMYASALAPAGYLLCDGTNISQTTYPELATVLGSTKLPDLRNMFVRGWSGVGGALDGTFAQHQDTTRLPRTNFTGTAANAGSHTHNLWQRRMNAYSGEGFASIPNTSAEGISAGGSTNTDGRNMDADGAHTHAITIAGGDAETAPKHVILAYYIKATDTGMRIV